MLARADVLAPPIDSRLVSEPKHLLDLRRMQARPSVQCRTCGASRTLDPSAVQQDSSFEEIDKRFGALPINLRRLAEDPEGWDVFAPMLAVRCSRKGR